ncbi:NAD(P)/FAD-dependent oxidoreductase [Aquabacter spiritensis]|uniref:Sulfide:quinone oxidoreductase n=1 Tax=Aquabacter spiritensis TaxID=933073 RepID=A0A4V2UXS2_9HYPH|nr:FAD/NAD(P)-binding oxidoreductase [Aquabacter spiritensis]TCT04618.1 sulfide:quinone oxidoreductase [Aquabacter spiritensis]
MTDTETTRLDRRRVLLGGLSALGAAGLSLAVPSAPSRAEDRSDRVATKARIVVAGAGAAGLASAARLAQRLDGAEIILIDKRRAHYYQPGFTLIAAGLQPPSYAVSQTRDYIPGGASLIEEAVAEIDPVGKTVVTESGRAVPYDFLVVATGLDLDYGAIPGMDVTRIGTNGLGSVYAGPDAAAATYAAMSRFAETGGAGLFLRPATEMKCAGAPLKYTFITDDVLRRRGNRGKAELTYNAQNATLFSVPIVSEKVRMLFQDRGVKVNYSHVLSAIDLQRRIATFASPGGQVQMPYDFINVIPPMRAPAVVRASALAWQSGPFAADGWMEVERDTLRHRRFPDVFGVGDVAGVPKGKTAASVKWQVPVAIDHLVAGITGRPSAARYNGYTSCPLITRIGQAMLVEFDYDNNLTPSFPGIIAPLEELWISWVMKEIALKPTYLAMLRGKA